MSATVRSNNEGNPSSVGRPEGLNQGGILGRPHRLGQDRDVFVKDLIESGEEEEEEGEELEFDDGDFELPNKSLRDKPNSPLMPWNKNIPGSSKISNPVSDDLFRSTVKVPLNDEREKPVSSPSSQRIAMVYKARHGTPLKGTPLIKRQTTNEEKNENEDDEFDESQESLVRNLKLITSNNKLSPRGSSFQENESPEHNKKRGGDSIFQYSPPSNLKVRPSRQLFQHDKTSEATWKSQSPLYEQIDSRSLDFGYVNGSSRATGSPGFPRRNRSLGVASSPPKQSMEATISNSKIDSSSGSNYHQSLLRASESGNDGERLRSSKILAEKIEPKNNDDISRDDLLERINLTINSIRDNSEPTSENSISRGLNPQLRLTSPHKFTSPVKNPSPLRSLVQRDQNTIDGALKVDFSEGNVIQSKRSHVEVEQEEEDFSTQEDESSGELDIGENYDFNNSIRISSLSDSEDELLDQLDTRLQAHKRRREIRGNEDNTVAQGLSGNSSKDELAEKYERSRNLFDNHFDTSLPKVIVSDRQTQSSIPKVDEGWTAEKWLKLTRVLNSPNLTESDLLNSKYLLNSLDCSRDELKQRINFLVEFNKIKQKTGLLKSSESLKERRRAKILKR